jgi:hypothetical protein
MKIGNRPGDFESGNSSRPAAQKKRQKALIKIDRQEKQKALREKPLSVSFLFNAKQANQRSLPIKKNHTISEYYISWLKHTSKIWSPQRVFS